MAAADMMVVVIAVVVEQVNNIYSLVNFMLITPVCSVTLAMKMASMDCSVWLTVLFTFDRCIAICCYKLREKYCTERTATVVITTACVVGCLRCIPFYFVVEPYVIIDNVPWSCVLKKEYLTLPTWKAYELFDTIITPSLPICLILLFNALTVRHIIAANRIRRGLRSNSDNQKDAEVENRRKSMILLFALSGNFVLLWMTYVVHSVNWQVQNFLYTDKYLNTPIYIVQQVGFMSRFLSTCTNTCIYGLTQRKFREELRNGAKYLFSFNGKLC
ncbi:probable G-protein coupled receptor 139 [Mobula hypostoma]|uniref:probable G-protein coupled receptor 139 n=1 Tax=Mobula hypostoma TaxID=723540 RepID=UPI002FC30AB1